MNFTLRQLSYFLALAEHGHFGRAAESVHVSQPALSVQIRELEGHLGGALVERGARSAVLTPLGRQVLPQAKQILAQAQALARSARWRDGLSGELRLGMIPTIAPYLLPGALAELRSRDTALDVQVTEAKTERLLQALDAGSLDAAVMALPSGAETLIEKPLFQDRFLLAGSQSRLQHLQQNHGTIAPSQISTGQLLLLEDGHCLTDQALEVCGHGRGHAQINMGASSMTTLSQLVGAGFGLTLIPELAASAEQRAAPPMALMRFSGAQPARQIGLVRRASSLDDGWFSDLAQVLQGVGTQIIDQSRDLPMSG